MSKAGNLALLIHSAIALREGWYVIPVSVMIFPYASEKQSLQVGQDFVHRHNQKNHRHKREQHHDAEYL